MQVLEQYGVNLGTAAACGVANYGLSYVISMDKAVNTDMTGMLKVAGVSAASEAVSSIVTNQLLPTLAGMSSMDGVTLKMYTSPILSGLIYSFATDSVVKNLDQRSFMEKFLIQVGSSAAANYIMAPAAYKVASD